MIPEGNIYKTIRLLGEEKTAYHDEAVIGRINGINLSIWRLKPRFHSCLSRSI